MITLRPLVRGLAGCFLGNSIPRHRFWGLLDAGAAWKCSVFGEHSDSNWLDLARDGSGADGPCLCGSKYFRACGNSSATAHIVAPPVAQCTMEDPAVPQGGRGMWDLNSKGQPGSLRFLQHAGAALLLSAAALTGCGQSASTIGEIPGSGLDPSYRDVIAGYVKKTFKDYPSYEAFEISDPRWVHSFHGWSWLTCVRFQDRGRRRTYALFLNASEVIDARYAVQTDECDMQAYIVFEQMGGDGLAPLH